MTSRRKFLSHSGALVIGAQSTAVFAGSKQTYEDAVRSVWRHGNASGAQGLQRELVRYAILAPSSHNTQCWKFKLESERISILPDLSRRCPVVDPDDHHLFVSLGCAAENLVQAAAANGLNGDASFDESGEGSVRIGLRPAPSVRSTLFEAIPQRQCTRAEFDAKPLSLEDLKLLEQAGTGTGVRVVFFTNKPSMEGVLEYVLRGNSAQFNDKPFLAELKKWIRFGESEAVERGDGLFSRSSGNPSLPRWLGSLMFDFFVSGKTENNKTAKQVRSSAGIAVFVSEVNDKAHWIEAGRCYERFALQATALGIRNAFLNQPVEVSSLRPQFASYLGIGQQRPDLVVRFGRGPAMPQSLRRPLDAVIV
ncbi:MAG: Acg family FMN-binding oxidoreductase [Burkholderiales bacterium]